MISYKQAETREELIEILDLQLRNLPDSISAQERSAEGFVTVRHELDILQDMNEKCPHSLAIKDDKLIGYALSMHPDFSRSIQILKPMFRVIDEVIPDSVTYLVMGQICIDKPFRRQGIFKGLYSFMKEKFKNEFDWIITEVDTKNQRSLLAHKNIGFKQLYSYSCSGTDWELIYLPI